MRLKKVLILAYDFPPYVSVGGLRPYSWYKYFREMGVDPIVVTRQWGNKYGNELDYIASGDSDTVIVEKSERGTIIRSPYKPNLANRIMLRHGEKRLVLLRKLITAWYEFFQWVFNTGPKVGLYREADAFLKTNKVDAIIATGDPFVLFRYASKLSNKYGIPWIADYRDPWSHNNERGGRKWLCFFNYALEKYNVKSCLFVTTASELFKIKINSLFPEKDIFVLPNGYDHKTVELAREVKTPNDMLRFAFVGTIYDWHPWKSVIRVFARYHNAYPSVPFELNFYGINKSEEVRQEIKEHAPSLNNYVKIFGRMPNNQLLPELGGNHVMLLFNYYSFIGTKIFDYLGLKRQIILCYTEDKEANQLKARYYRIEEVEGISKQTQADLIEATHSGIVVKDAEHFFQVLEKLFDEFEKTRNISCNSIGIEKYSRVHQVKKLAELIRSYIR